MKALVRSSLVLGSLSVLVSACGGGAAQTESTTEAVVVATAPEASGNPLIIGGAVSNYGEATLNTGFLPDPHTAAVTSGPDNMTGDSVNVSELGLTPQNSGTCTGFVTRQPDYIVHVEAAGQLLRFLVNAPADTTLVINDGAGNWWCSDDDGGDLNPLIEMTGPTTGQYDIWVGSYQAGANIAAVLSVTELPAN